MNFTVWRADGTQVHQNDPMVPTTDHPMGEGTVGVFFHSVSGPRKIMVSTDNGYQEYYPSVYDVEIRGSDGYVWNPVSKVGKGMEDKLNERERMTMRQEVQDQDPTGVKALRAIPRHRAQQPPYLTSVKNPTWKGTCTCGDAVIRDTEFEAAQALADHIDQGNLY